MITTQGTFPFPPGTDAQALNAFGASCTTLSKALKGASTSVSATTSSAANSWSGAAATTFVSHMTSRATGLSSNASAVARIQPIVSAYAKAMTAAEAEYNVAVAAQQAAMAALPFSAAAEAAAIAAEAAAVAGLEAAGFACAAALATVVAQLGLQEVMAFDSSLVSELEQQIGNGVTALTQAVGPAVASLMPTSASATPASPVAQVAAPTTLAGALGVVSAAYKQPGTIGVVKAADGRWLVALPGIEGFTPSSNPLNLIDAGQQVATGTSAYEAGVADALKKAGAQPGDSVMFVSHSQGGLTAVDLANDPSFTSQYHVTDILTAGSPIGDLSVPSGTNLLSVENTVDLVPHIDNTSNSSTHSTFSFTDEEGGITQNHDVNNVYLKEFGASDFTSNPQAVSFQNNAAPYLTGSGANAQFFTLSSAGSVAPTPAPGPTPTLSPGAVLPPVVVLPPAPVLVGAPR